MIPLTALWLPILLSTVIVFFASFIMHMSAYDEPFSVAMCVLLLSLAVVENGYD